jgi:hypothetical protein
MSALPAWAATPECRATLAHVIAAHPAISVYDDGLSSWNGRHVRGEPAQAIRAIYDAWYDTQLDACSSLTHDLPEYHALRDATLAVETADRLMERLLTTAEPVAFIPTIVRPNSDGGYRVQEAA